MDESLQGAAWLMAQIKASAGIMATLTGGVHFVQAPQGAIPPYAIVSPMGGRDVQAVAGYRLMWEGTFQVRVWGYAVESDAFQAAADAVDALFQPNGDASRGGTTALAQILSCVRDNPLPPLPDWDGQQLRIGIGGLYRLQVRALA